MDINRLKIIDLFAGIGGIRLGFESIGAECVFSSEWDKSAQDMYEENFGERPFGDINEIDPFDVPDHDFLLAGFPCQPFSIAGKQLGFADTRGTLFFNIEKILEAKKPYGFLLENVRRLTTHDNGRTFQVITTKLEQLGYTVYTKVLNTLDFGVPQKRERIYLVGFRDPIHFTFPPPVNYYKPLSDYLDKDEDVPENYFVSEQIKTKRFEKVKPNYVTPSIWHENIGGNISALPYSCALRAGGSYNYLLVNGVRRLTGREMLRLQGFPESFKINVPYTQARKIAGNSVTVDVIKLIAQEVYKSLQAKKPQFNETQLEVFNVSSNDSTESMDDMESVEETTAEKAVIDNIIKKARVHLYKPIQIAEILYRDRVVGDIDLSELETYRTKSKKWRDVVCVPFLGRTSTSSAKYQDDLFSETAVPPAMIVQLGDVNREKNGVVEAYIYTKFKERYTQMTTALDYSRKASLSSFQLPDFLNLFWQEAGLRRSIDKVYEIVVYSLFSVLVEQLGIQIKVSLEPSKIDVLKEFETFARKVIGIDSSSTSFTSPANINRVGVTNAADRGLDMWANFGPAIQIKHLSLTEELAKDIVGTVTSDSIVIVCKDSEEKVITSLLGQLGWKSRIQSIVTESELITWYEKALRGTYSNLLGKKLLASISDEILLEFPSSDASDFTEFYNSRGYNELSDDLWK